MKTQLHLANTRGHANHGWLNSYHTFSFAGYNDPNRVHFGALRVLNDDTVAGGMGFGTHPHQNMEIISIPLEGDLQHKDSMGNLAVIKKGEVQIMSAGTGVQHSEKNNDSKKEVKFLQIWVFPEKQNIQPRYDQQYFDLEANINDFVTVVSPINSEDSGVKINQNAWFSMLKLDSGKSNTYHLKDKNNGVYVFVLDGDILIGNQKLATRDGLGISETTEFNISTSTESSVLFMEVPMEF
jgi:redox-sensitive bicupin YhaK (pirin superfamily)